MFSVHLYYSHASFRKISFLRVNITYYAISPVWVLNICISQGKGESAAGRVFALHIASSGFTLLIVYRMLPGVTLKAG